MTDGVEPLADLDATDERGVSADLVRAYLNGIGRTKLLTAVRGGRRSPSASRPACSPRRS